MCLWVQNSKLYQITMKRKTWIMDNAYMGGHPRILLILKYMQAIAIMLIDSEAWELVAWQLHVCSKQLRN
jgi:hypothetical protein